MSAPIHHCPFLNRSDARCSRNFSLERLHNAYDYCFGEYSSCSVYPELLKERRMRRAEESASTAKLGGRPSLWRNDATESEMVILTHAGRRIGPA